MLAAASFCWGTVHLLGSSLSWALQPPAQLRCNALQWVERIERSALVSQWLARGRSLTPRWARSKILAIFAAELDVRPKLVVGNWKMHGSLPENANLLEAVRSGASALRYGMVAVCVPFPYLGQAQQCLSGSRVAWGAQNVSAYPKGPYTGEVSAGMLREFGCTFVIVGHSERRALCGEDDAAVAAKFGAAVDAGLIPILCIGETLVEREAGATERVVERQLSAVTSRFGVEGFSRAVLAYEPVWAIGTGRTATPEQAQAVHAFLRERVAAKNPQVGALLQILYGGSVKGANAESLFAMSDVDGGLVGGASLDAPDFLSICAAADRMVGEVA